MKYIDSHTHLDLKVFNENRTRLIEEMFENQSIIATINPAIHFESNEGMRVKLNKYPNIYYASGIHPMRVPIQCRDDVKAKIVNQLKEYARDPKNVAIGETGLDYHKPELLNEFIIEEQKWWFKQQIALSQELGLPLILHVRNCDEGVDKKFGVEYKSMPLSKEYLEENAYEDAIAILKENLSDGESYRGVVHCFNAGPEIAEQFIELGFCLGIGGRITYENDVALKESVKKVDLNYLLLETDSPYVFPEGGEGQFNTPLNLHIIAKKIAELKEVDIEEVVNVTTENSIKVFDLKI